MNPPTHTPGPWVLVIDKGTSGVFRYEIRTAAPHNPAGWLGKHIATLNAFPTMNPNENGALIAAAPDLLAACEAALSFGEGHPDRTPGWHDARLTTQLMLRAAIAKAKGDPS